MLHSNISFLCFKFKEQKIQVSFYFLKFIKSVKTKLKFEQFYRKNMRIIIRPASQRNCGCLTWTVKRPHALKSKSSLSNSCIDHLNAIKKTFKDFREWKNICTTLRLHIVDFLWIIVLEIPQMGMEKLKRIKFLKNHKGT